MQTKHYIVSENGKKPSRVAVAIDFERFQLAQISGPAPETWVLGAILAADETLVEAANAAQCRRQHDYAVTVHHGMSGSKDFRLIERRNDDLADYPTAARIHVSMYGKLNDGVKCWIGDPPPLVAAMMDSDRTLFVIPENGAIKEVPTREGLAWRRPAAELLTILDNGEIAYDRTPGADQITADMPLFLGPNVLKRLAAIEAEGEDTALADWQIAE
jgi:hypothetical protein